jgi:hypothetical protein
MFSTTFVRNISHSKKTSVRYCQKMYIGLHVKYPLFLLDFNETQIFSNIFKKRSNFHENPSSGSRVLPYGQPERETDMTKRKVAFRKIEESA